MPQQIPDFFEKTDVPNFFEDGNQFVGPINQPQQMQQPPSLLSRIGGGLNRLAFGPSEEEYKADITRLDPQIAAEIEKHGGKFTPITGMEGSILPKFKQPETYWGGFLNSLYEDIIRPQGNPLAILGSSGIKPIPRINPQLVQEVVGATKLARSQVGLDIPPRLGLPPAPIQPRFIGGSEGIADIKGINAIPDISQVKGELTPVSADIAASGAGLVNRPLTTGGNIARLGEVAEQNRLANLDYAAAEQQPGTRLNIPSSGRYELPSVSGETTGGFTPQTTSQLPYPLNVIPNRLRPRTVQSEIISKSGLTPLIDTPKDAIVFDSPLAEPVEKELSINRSLYELPTATKKTVTLYRGEAVPTRTRNLPEWVKNDPKFQQIQQDAAGRWFTHDPKIAQWYVDNAGGGRITKVEVPEAVANATKVEGNAALERWSANPRSEFFLPRKYSARAQQYITPNDTPIVGDKPPLDMSTPIPTTAQKTTLPSPGKATAFGAEFSSPHIWLTRHGASDIIEPMICIVSWSNC